MKPRENIKVRKIVAAARKAVVPILKPVRPAVKTEARPVSRERHPHLRRVIGAGFGLILLACHAWAQPAVPPPQPASLSEVIAGTDARKFISPKTARDAGLTAPTNGVTAETATNIAAFQAQIATNQLAKANTNLWQPKSDNLTDLAAINGSDEGYLIGGSAANGYHHKLYLGTGLSVTSPGLDYLSLATPLQSFGALANASGVLTNNGSGTFGWYPVASLGGGGGGGSGDGWFWGTNTASGDSYTNKWGVQWDQPGSALRFGADDYILTGNYWHFGVGIANSTETSIWDSNGDFYGRTAYFDSYGSPVSSYALDLDTGAFSGGTVTATNVTIASGGSFSTPVFIVDAFYATNTYGIGAALWTNAANAFNGNAYTNQSLIASRLMMTGTGKQQTSAAASGAVPVDADGSATTGAQLQGLGAMLTNDTRNVYLTGRLQLATYSDVVTNLWSLNTPFDLGKNDFRTQGATTTGITGVANTSTTTVERWGQLTILATGDITFTNPVSMKTSDYLTSRIITNGNSATISCQVVPGRVTNLFIVQTK